MKYNKELLENFLNDFSLEKLNDLEISKYTNTGSGRFDFTYKIEWELDCFGGIKGGSSYKFGIYKCNSKPDIKTKGYKYDPDNKYAWAEKYEPKGKPNCSYQDVFEEIRKRIVAVVQAASGEEIEYDTIENTDLGEAFKWKVAFLYSKNRLVPVYKKEALYNAAKLLGYEGDEKSTIAELQKWLKKYYDDHKDNYCPKENGSCKDDEGIYFFGAYIWKIGSSDLSLSNQIIKYGAPGTGKTYTAKKEAEEFFDIWKLDAQNDDEEFRDHYEFVQFHPSYSYEDFIEGIKPVVDGTGGTILKLKNGIFKSLCRKAAKYEKWLLENGIIQQDDEDKQLDKITVKEVRGRTDSGDCPFKIPNTANDDDLITKYIPPYFFVIDEINRTDLSRVFGELMYCLEYRGYEGRIKTQYSELESKETNTIFYEDKKGEHWFFIPNNVYIIGTMNTIDRSIESFDFALRRRFLWQRIDPNESVLQEYFEKKGKTDFAEYIIPFWKKLNDAIKENTILGPDYQIGHSYLMKLDKYPKCTKTAYRNIIWEKHIHPILEEYFRGMGEEGDKQIDNLKNNFIPSKQNSKSPKAASNNTSPAIEDNNE